MKIKIPKPRINCKCGKNITPNTFLNHLKGRKCSLSEEQKAPIKELIKLYQIHRSGWKKDGGENAVRDPFWWISIYKGETIVDDWVFECPRPVGVIPPNTLKRMSKERIGLGNPVVKKAPKYDIKELHKFAKEQIQQVGTTHTSIKNAIKAIEAKYPKFRYGLTGTFQLKNHRSSLVAWALGISLEKAKRWGIKKRGIQISKGQRNSPEFVAMASKQASILCSRWRITKPHIELFERWKREDPNAVIEFKVENGYRCYSYDIYSPKYNLLIEMHGHFWHRPAKDSLKSRRVRAMIKKNLKNDITKQQLAVDMKYNFLVFWDDQKDKWESQIEEFLNNVKKDCQGAQPGSQAGIRPGSPQQPQLPVEERQCSP